MFRSSDIPPDIQSGTGSMRYLATGATTDGALGLYQVEMGPDAPGP